MRRLTSLVLATLLFVSMGSALTVSAHDGVHEADLIGTTWELISIEAEAGAPIAIEDSARYTIYFIEEGQIAFGADCNVGGATYTIDGDSITVTPGPMTMAYCGDESNSDQFVLSLNSATSIAIDEIGQLILTPGDDAAEGAGTLTLQQSLIGTIWQWTVFQSSDESEIAPEDPSRFTIEFVDEDTVVIGADCNRGRGVYSRNGSEIDIEIQLLTRAFCGEDSLHDQYLQFLDDAVSLVFVDGGLHFSFPMDAGVMTFEPVPYGAAEIEAGS